MNLKVKKTRTEKDTYFIFFHCSNPINPKYEDNFIYKEFTSHVLLCPPFLVSKEIHSFKRPISHGSNK